jgi:sugar (pentulose or hexulose) kinase
MAGFAGDRPDIVAVGLCTIRFCRALLAADGSLAEPVLSWMDERVSRPYEPGNPLVRYVTTSSGYITHRLTGQFVDAAANYQGVWPIDQDTAAWSGDPAAYAATGMARDMLFDLVPPGGRLGQVTPAAAGATGIPAGLPVYATANDKAVEALGSGLKEDGGVLLSLGTYIAAMTIGSSARSAGDSYWVTSRRGPESTCTRARGSAAACGR